MLEDLGLKAERVNRTSGAKTGTVLDIQESSSRVEVDSTVTLVVAMKKKATPAAPTFSPTPTPTPKPTKSPTPTPTNDNAATGPGPGPGHVTAADRRDRRRR